MPELPEVQTIASQLQKIIPNHMIRDVWSDWPKTLQIIRYKEHIKIKKTNVSRKEKDKLFESFYNDIVGKKIKSVERVGKNIIINLSENHVLLVHQKLSGHLLLRKWNIVDGVAVSQKKDVLRDRVNGYIHLIIYLSGGKMLALSDLRKFAKVISGPKKKVFSLSDISKLGPDPLKKELTLSKFENILKSKKGAIKAVLLKQEVISGIGNIYADEILWSSKVHPMTPADTISGIKLKKMYNEMRRILKFSIKIGGDSMSDFRNIYGEKGGYQKYHKVYQRREEPCFLCKTNIERIKIGGRSSHFCPKCQKLKS